jgi:ferredoxin
MGKRVVIDTEACIGCENCVTLCPQVFQMEEGFGKARVLAPEGGPEDCIEEAIETCPVECISWEVMKGTGPGPVTGVLNYLYRE